MVDKWDKETSPSKYELVLKRLEHIDSTFEVDLFGGEPTLHPEFIHILERLDAMEFCQHVEVKTNLSRSQAFLEKTFVSDKIRIAASYHAQYYNQEFLDKCIAFKDKNFYCHINLSDKSNDWDQILNMLNEFDKHGVKYDLNILITTPSYRVKYSPKFFELFEPYLKNIADKNRYPYEFADGTVENLSVFESYKNNLACFTGYKCKALLYEITKDGNIINSCSRDPAPFFIKGEHGDKEITCPRTFCHADMMLHFPKRYVDNSKS